MSSSPPIGETLGSYQITELIGRGGMAFVYRALELSTGRSVALKVLDEALASDPVFVERFRREARIAASLQHPHILALYRVEAGEGPSPRPYLVMPYVAGGTLANLVTSQGPLPLSTVIHVAEQLASALDYAHQRGVVHRDVKPSNVLIEQDWAWLADFGIAKAWDSVRFTIPGLALGTPAYMAPEQVRGEDVDARADLYALGIIVYELIAGRTPFAGTPSSIQAAQLATMPPALGDHLPANVRAALERMLAKPPEARFQDGASFVSALRTTQPPVHVSPAADVTLKAQQPALQVAPTRATPGVRPGGIARTSALMLAAGYAVAGGLAESLYFVPRLSTFISYGWILAGLIGSATALLALRDSVGGARWQRLAVGAFCLVATETVAFAVRVNTHSVGLPAAAVVAAFVAGLVGAAAMRTGAALGGTSGPRVAIPWLAGVGTLLGVGINWAVSLPAAVWLLAAGGLLAWELLTRKTH